MSGASHLMSAPPRAQRQLGLPVSVIHLRRDGQRITGTEFRAAVPMTGRLMIRPTDKWQSGSGATHMADLLREGVLQMGAMCKPLFNPVIELTDERGFVLSGYEIDSRGGDKVLVEQVWLVRPLTSVNVVL